MLQLTAVFVVCSLIASAIWDEVKCPSGKKQLHDSWTGDDDNNGFLNFFKVLWRVKKYHKYKILIDYSNDDVLQWAMWNYCEKFEHKGPKSDQTCWRTHRFTTYFLFSFPFRILAWWLDVLKLNLDLCKVVTYTDWECVKTVLSQRSGEPYARTRCCKKLN